MTNWWEAGGASGAVAAYEPLGAPSLADSYINRVTPGTYNAAPGVAPTFDTATGWTFDRSVQQYLTTGVVPAGDGSWSMIARATIDASPGFYVAGALAFGPTRQFYLRVEQTSNNAGYGNGSGNRVNVAPGFSAGVLAVAGSQGYRNGVADGTPWAQSGSVAPPAVFIGTINSSGAPSINGKSSTVVALAIYNTTLTGAQVLAISDAMAALPTGGSWSGGGGAVLLRQHREWWAQHGGGG